MHLVFLSHCCFQQTVLISTHDLYFFARNSPLHPITGEEEGGGRKEAAHGLERLSGSTELESTTPKPPKWGITCREKALSNETTQTKITHFQK